MDITIPAGSVSLPGILEVPASARGIVVFAHGSGSSRLSPRNAGIAAYLRQNGHFGTLLFDLLTPKEDARCSDRFEIGLLAERLGVASDWLRERPGIVGLPLAYFGASTGAGAALVAAAERPGIVQAVVSRGGRPDLARDALARVESPTLLIVGGRDVLVLELNRGALGQLASRDKELAVIPDATHLFEEPGALDEVSRLSRDWFERYVGI